MRCKKCGKEKPLNKNQLCDDCARDATEFKQKMIPIVSIPVAIAIVVVGFAVMRLAPKASPTSKATSSLSSMSSVSTSSAFNQNSSSSSQKSVSSASSSKVNASSISSSSSTIVQPSNGSPKTSPLYPTTANTALTRGLDNGYTTAQNITADGISFIGGIRTRSGKNYLDIWALNNTASDILGGFTVKIGTEYLNGNSGDYYISGNDAVATSTQYVNPNYEENVVIDVNTSASLDNVPIRIYTQKGTTKLAEMTLKNQN
ncbi:MAG TPA: hypothetical protein DEP42_05280 [Ruminococcaceae bacterium]|nr:hypothetical protein [Oscillospiraceae bacterium]